MRDFTVKLKANFTETGRTKKINEDLRNQSAPRKI